jgi:hypothetical protein
MTSDPRPYFSMGMPTPDSVKRLVDRFDQDRKVPLSGDCKEEQLPKAKTPHRRESIQRQIATTDNQIDALVCELHGLKDAEVRIAGGVQKRKTQAHGEL